MPKNQYKSVKKPSFGPKNIKNSYGVIGVDEAGRGAWAGPVVAACVAWNGKNPLRGILRDSKKMTPKDREKSYEEILCVADCGKLLYGIGIINNDIIDSVGIREANRLAMEEALQEMQKTKYKVHNEGSSIVILEQVNPLRSRDERDPGIQENKPLQSEAKKSSGLDSRLRGNDEQYRILIDGRDNYSFDIPNLPAPEYIVRGDSKIKQIMAASILAKVTRDRIMIGYENIFPRYGFEKHKGYGTQFHQKALKKLGIAKIHRKSYKPIKLATSGKGL